MKDYYKILNITLEAEYQDVIKAYNTFIKYFNQKSFLNDDDKNKIKDIKEAYFILGNYHNRRKYDNKREGYRKDIDNYCERVFFRPNIDYNMDIEKKLKNVNSDRLNNQKEKNKSSQIEYGKKLPDFSTCRNDFDLFN